MALETEAKILREGSAVKRAAILSAARERILADGFDGTSVDAIAATAGVSKRTVYDYFGDKQALLIAIIESTSSALMATINAALDEYLTDPTDLEEALTAFALRILSTALVSSDYATLIRLITTESAHLPANSADYWMASEPEDRIAERFAEFHAKGLLEAPRPRLAADHFAALALAIPLEKQRDAPDGDSAVVEESVLDGVRAFLRAYAPRP
jgi:TetR/AcrR family transcriptional regulator, mexJK operon transcriptional repressor